MPADHGLAEQIRDPLTALAAQPDPRAAAKLRRKLWFQGAPAGLLAQFDPAEITGFQSRNLMLHAAIAAEAGLLDTAMHLLRTALRDMPDAFLRFGYAGLLDRAAACDPDIAKRHAPMLERIAVLRKGFGSFARAVTARDVSICVVGNSPVLLGEGRGAFIDGHDLVIRFNSFRAGGGYRTDLGAKIDIWARTPRFQSNWRREGEGFAMAITAGGPAYWRSPHGIALAIDAALAGIPHDTIDPLRYFDVTSCLGHKPSSGLMVLGWLRGLRGSLAGVSIEGFGLTDQPDRGMRRYFADVSRGDAAVPHDWGAERALLDAWLAEAADGLS